MDYTTYNKLTTGQKMRFASRLKGNITQALLRALLEDSCYHIVPLGIEEVIRKLSILDEEKYTQLNLPKVLRKLPDFFVSDESLNRCWLVEVKYRKAWNEETKESLGNEIYDQVKNWGPLHLLVFLGTPAKKDASLPSAYIGVLRLAMLDGEIHALRADGTPFAKWSEVVWRSFSRIQGIFPALNEEEKLAKKTIAQVKLLLPQLQVLDIFE